MVGDESPLNLTCLCNKKATLMARFVLLILFCLLPVTAFGQRAAVSFQGGLGLTAASFDKQIAGTEGSLGVQFGFSPRLYRVLALRVEFGVEYLGAVCFEAGAVCEAERSRSPSSDTFMLSGSVAAGMMTRPLRLGTRSEGVDVAVGLLAGGEWVEAGFGRGDCLNCRVRGLDVRGGFFLEPTLEGSFSPDFGLGLSYRIYSPASDLQGRFTVRFMARG